MIIYIAGPMRGYPKFNFPAFDKAAEVLREMGYGVISPAELDRDAGFNEDNERLPVGFLQQAMRRDIQALLEADAIMLLPDWEKSEGVAIELAVARALGLKVLTFLGNGFAEEGWAA